MVIRPAEGVGTTEDFKRTGAQCVQATAVVGMILALPFIVLIGAFAWGQVGDAVRPILAGDAPELRDVWLAVYCPAVCVLMCWAWLRIGRALLWQMQDTAEGRDTGPADWWAAAYHPLIASRAEIARRIAAGEGWPHRRRKLVIDLSDRSTRVLAWLCLLGWVAGCTSARLLWHAWNESGGRWPSAAAGAIALIACLCLVMPWAWREAGVRRRVGGWLLTAILWASVIGGIAEADSWFQVMMFILLFALIGVGIRCEPPPKAPEGSRGGEGTATPHGQAEGSSPYTPSPDA